MTGYFLALTKSFRCFVSKIDIVTASTLNNHRITPFMPDAKRRRLNLSVEQTTMDASSTPSPFMPAFESFRNELDEHHDRRERIIKASRDITALSKKM